MGWVDLQNLEQIVTRVFELIISVIFQTASRAEPQLMKSPGLSLQMKMLGQNKVYLSSGRNYPPVISQRTGRTISTSIWEEDQDQQPDHSQWTIFKGEWMFNNYSPGQPSLGKRWLFFRVSPPSLVLPTQPHTAPAARLSYFVIIKHLLQRSQPGSDFNPTINGRINEFVQTEPQNADIRQNKNEFDVQVAVPLPNLSLPPPSPAGPKIELLEDRQRPTKFEEATETFGPIRELKTFNNPTIVNNFDNVQSNLLQKQHEPVNNAVVTAEQPRGANQFQTQGFNQNEFTFRSLPSRFSSPQSSESQEYFFGPPQQIINMRDGSYTIITLLR